jgi:chemotaxis protein methyltransferase CheR
MRRAEIEAIEIDLLLEVLARRHGYDFSGYARASLKRRVLALPLALGCERVADLIPKLLWQPELLQQTVSALAVSVTELFRDPEVFLALRRQVLPLLASYPRINIWQAGCATGEEAYSLAIMFAEEGLLSRVQIYATDISDAALAHAEEGVYPDRWLDDYTHNYQKAGGTRNFSDYYVRGYGFFKLHDELKEKISFAHHNLVSDAVFCDAHLVVCRNVLIYFNRDLQERVQKLLCDSLVRGGYLCLGPREGLTGAASACLKPVDAAMRLYRRVGEP